MAVFGVCVLILVVGYVVYGTVVERVFGADGQRETPAYTLRDNVDYLPMPLWKAFLVQLLDIAGVGPVFGPILGALYGPQALIWIVLGTLFAGGVHDYFSGMLSVRGGGQSIPEVVGEAFGQWVRYLMRGFSLLLLVLVGVIFARAPADLLASLTGVPGMLLLVCVFAYYFFATILPIDKIIGRLYPFFGALLLFMSIGIMIGLILSSHPVLPNLDFFTNTHPQMAHDGRQLPVWPLLFITVTCGALSGFHSTQSPIIARCLQNERHGRRVFYGAMVAEGIIALIWATVGMSFYGSTDALLATIQSGSPSAVVEETARALLGTWGGWLAILGVVVLPVTSGDTAFRAARLILAESFSMRQDTRRRRLSLAVPLFGVGVGVSLLDFSVLWQYFGWSNQVLAALVLWSAGLWLARRGAFHWIATLPAAFMTAVCVSFLLYMPLGFRLGYWLSVYVGVASAGVALVGFLLVARHWRGEVAEVS